MYDAGVRNYRDLEPYHAPIINFCEDKIKTEEIIDQMSNAAGSDDKYIEFSEAFIRGCVDKVIDLLGRSE